MYQIEKNQSKLILHHLRAFNNEHGQKKIHKNKSRNKMLKNREIAGFICRIENDIKNLINPESLANAGGERSCIKLIQKRNKNFVV